MIRFITLNIIFTGYLFAPNGENLSNDKSSDRSRDLSELAFDFDDDFMPVNEYAQIGIPISSEQKGASTESKPHTPVSLLTAGLVANRTMVTAIRKQISQSSSLQTGSNS